MKTLSPADRAYVIQHIKLIREATQNCSKFSREWNVRNDEFNEWYVAQFQVPVDDADPVHYVNVKKSNLGLTNAFDAWSFWQRELMRLTASLEAEKTAREMMEWNGAG